MIRRSTTLDLSSLPPAIRRTVQGADITDSSCSTAARVYCVEKDGGLFLKVAAPGALKDEAMMTGVFFRLGLAAEVLDYETAGSHDYLLTRRVPGEDCIHPAHLSQPERLSALIGEQLRRLHELKPVDSRLPGRLAPYLERVRRGLALGCFDPSFCRGLWDFASAREAQEAALAGCAALKEDVLVHGDYCLPNILLDGWRFSGFVDLGGSGLADRHFDLLDGIWSLNYNLGSSRYTARFLDAYGRDRADPELLRCAAAMECVAAREAPPPDASGDR